MSSIQDISDELYTKLNEIRLSKNHPLTKNKIFILLEGKTDVKLFRNIFNHQNTNIDQINGKEKIIKVLEKLKNEGFTKIFGIKDSDFDNLENITYSNINLFITDYADMELHMLESQALESLVNEFSIESCHKVFLENLRRKLYAETIFIGYLRWYNERYFKENGDYLFRFKGLNFNDFIKISHCDFSIDLNVFFNKLIDFSNINLTKNDLENIISDLKLISNNYLQICNGHDITKLLSLLFNNQNSDTSNLNQKRIEEALRLSYSFEYFTSSTLYHSLQEWQNSYEIELFKT